MTANPIYCALDTAEVAVAQSYVRRLAGLVGGVKLGLEFFVAQGAEGIRAISASGVPIFLDLKLHDIPNTVAGAMRALVPLKPAMTTVHAAGGHAMMQAAKAAAREAAAEAGIAAPAILGVTVLTSLAEADLDALGIVDGLPDQVARLTDLAQRAGLDGVVCSAHEVEALRAQCGPGFLLVVPGIRPAWAVANDQKRVMTPAQALQAGADHLVIGRPITAAADPAAAARRVAVELAGAA
jgi:orotidine-5'-phosphate decarboxylase